jgi:hypothetical protein
VPPPSRPWTACPPRLSAPVDHAETRSVVLALCVVKSDTHISQKTCLPLRRARGGRDISRETRPLLAPPVRHRSHLSHIARGIPAMCNFGYCPRVALLARIKVSSQTTKKIEPCRKALARSGFGWTPNGAGLLLCGYGVQPMPRCTRTRDLEVHHKDRKAGKGIGNAKVLCNPCHKKTPDYGVPGNPANDFDEPTKAQAIRNAGNQCECTSTVGCH